MIDIKKMSNTEIMKMYSSILSSVYKEYKLFGITEDEYKKYLKEVILNSKKEYDETESFKVILQKKLTEYLNDIINERIANDKMRLFTFTNFINNKFNRTCSYEIVNENFDVLDELFNKYDYDIDVDLIVELLENKKILKMIRMVLKENKLRLEKDELKDIFYNKTLITFLETYCMMNNIELVKEDEEELPQEFFSDNLKIYFNEISKKKLLNEEEEKNLIIRMKSGDSKARKELIECNLRLAASIAKRYIGGRLSIEDLIQEANTGLIKAADKFDSEKGVRYSTYATWWARQCVVRAIQDKSRTVRIPVNLGEKIEKYKRVHYDLSNKLNREPTQEEMIEHTNFTEKQIKTIEKAQLSTFSLNKQIFEDETIEFGELIANPDDNVENNAIRESISLTVKDILKNSDLTDREKYVIALRFGMNDDVERTYTEIGSNLGVTRERVRQIEEKALLKLRKSKYSVLLAQCTDNEKESINSAKKIIKHYMETGEVILNSKKSKSSPGKKAKKLSEFFENVSHDDIVDAIKNLCDEDRLLLEKRYGSDFENPVGRVNKKERQMIGSIVSKIKTIMKKNNSQQKKLQMKNS